MNRLQGLLSIARKAGFCVIGQDNLKGYDKKLYVILLDKTAGKSLQREMKFLSSTRGIPILEVSELNKITAIENCKVLGVKNKNLSDSIIKDIKGE